MMGQKEKHFKQHPTLCLEDLVPQGNFYREVEAKLDLSFVRELVKDKYCWWNGRPSIDPVVFFKLQLIMFFEGIRSERQLMTMTTMRLDHLWYIGYDFDEPVPDHSSLSDIRNRYGFEVFQKFFEHIVELCIEAGLVWGKELYFDGTKVRANAALNGMVPRWYWEAKQHVEALFEQEIPLEETIQAQPEPPATQAEESPPIPSRLVEKYDGTRLSGSRTPPYKRITDQKVSPTDPDASPMKSSDNGRASLGYHTHYVVDGGKARIILAALVTPSSIMDNTPMLDLERWARFRWSISPDIVVGDTKYGTIPNIVGLEQDGIKAYIPTSDFSKRTKFYSYEHFKYDTERDLFICPQDHEIPLWSRRKSEDVFVYRADAKVCDACPVKVKCTDSKSGRHLRRSFFQEYLDQAEGYRQTEDYKKAMRKRQVWVEPLFGEGKQWHQMRWFRLRRLRKVNIEGLMRAAGQNIKRLLKHQNRSTRPPAQENWAALAVPKPFLDIRHVLSNFKWAILGRPSPC
jgi:transposase